jgi:transcriptional regulator of NAD metabolism
MEEEYLLNKMIKGKTEKEREIELMQKIIETKEKLQNARKNFEYAEDGMIDYYIYQIKANQSKLDYLIKLAKKKGVILSRDKEVKIRMILQKKLVG